MLIFELSDLDLDSSNMMTEGLEKAAHNGLRFVKGEIVQRIEYTPFGKERYVLNPALKRGPKFTDQIYDIEDGLYFYQSRYYDAVVGRFIQPDAIALADAGNPQTMNAYSYVLNNPLKYVDPTGQFVDAYDDEGGLFADSGGEYDRDKSEGREKEQNQSDQPLKGSGTTGDQTNNALQETPIEAKPGVDLTQLEASITSKFKEIKEIFEQHGAPVPVITDAYQDPRHRSDSRHYTNEAIDIRGNNVSDDKLRAIANDLQNRVGPEYDVVPEFFPMEPDKDHIHFEHDPKGRRWAD